MGYFVACFSGVFRGGSCESFCLVFPGIERRGRFYSMIFDILARHGGMRGARELKTISGRCACIFPKASSGAMDPQPAVRSAL